MKRRIEPSSLIPTNWDGFLRVGENKKELFRFSAAMCSTVDCFDNKVILSHDQSVVSKPNGDIGNLSPCTHEEADSRIFVHYLDSVREGNKRPLICTVDTDVVVTAIAAKDGFHLAMARHSAISRFTKLQLFCVLRKA